VVEQQRKKPVRQCSGPTRVEQEEMKALKNEIRCQHHRARKAEESLTKAQELLEKRDRELKDTIAEKQNLKQRSLDSSASVVR